jgi:hypothetical protein
MIFGVAKAINREHNAIGDCDAVIFDLSEVVHLGLTAALAIENAVEEAIEVGRNVYVVGARGTTRKRLEQLKLYQHCRRITPTSHATRPSSMRSAFQFTFRLTFRFKSRFRLTFRFASRLTFRFTSRLVVRLLPRLPSRLTPLDPEGRWIDGRAEGEDTLLLQPPLGRVFPLFRLEPERLKPLRAREPPPPPPRLRWPPPPRLPPPPRPPPPRPPPRAISSALLTP